jgi:cation diffusion facilitator family transporter
MMVAEIIGGLFFGSIALVADGLHMSTHAGALLLAALAYTYARRHAQDDRFCFGTGKVGDLAGFSSAIILAMIALLIGYEAVTRLFTPVAIHFNEAIPIAVLGLGVNFASAWLLSGGHHGHGHDHGHSHTHDETRVIQTKRGMVRLEIFEEGVPPRFRLFAVDVAALDDAPVVIETVRPGGELQTFPFEDRNGLLESRDEIPEPHEFKATLRIGTSSYDLEYSEHTGEDTSHRDNNMRAALLHVIADAAVSVFVIIGLILAWAFGWLWMDSLAGIIGAVVIASWSYSLIRDTGGILLDVTADRTLASNIRQAVESEGDRLSDLHLWRLGPGHLGAIVSVATFDEKKDVTYFRRRLAGFPSLSHLTVEVDRVAA